MFSSFYSTKIISCIFSNIDRLGYALTCRQCNALWKTLAQSDKHETNMHRYSFQTTTTIMIMMMMIMIIIIIIIIIMIMIKKIIIIIIIIIIIAFNGAVRDALQSPHCAVNHVQHIERLSRATCRVTCRVVQRDSSAIKFDRVEIAFI